MVALAKKGQPTNRPVLPKDEMYKYIIFRGSDIKDRNVCEPPKPHHGLPQDPAIVQAPYRSMVPSYNQLAASSLLSQQYAAALGLVSHLKMSGNSPSQPSSEKRPDGRAGCPDSTSGEFCLQVASLPPSSKEQSLVGLPSALAKMILSLRGRLPPVGAGELH
ncbi:hypothetical protein J4Q44_G00102210 [Coregonus suidteri]|uniref:Lsm14-like N-terminal domain-containing protein n=1 Tax=Coregonus suidteri TaxID=861788 RepID=A0AAN8QW91_9TELE